MLVINLYQNSIYPRSRIARNCVLVNRRGSPVPSAATASSSSNAGAMNRSRKFKGRALRVFVVPADNAVGRTENVIYRFNTTFINNFLKIIIKFLEIN